MQQTQTYKLNLIETSDTFSPAPLNENMEKLEAAIAAGDEALNQRLTVLEARKLVVGSYKGNSSVTQVINLGFTPRVVIAQSAGGSGFCWMATAESNKNQLSIVEGGFKAGYQSGAGIDMNDAAQTYIFLAIL